MLLIAQLDTVSRLPKAAIADVDFVDWLPHRERRRGLTPRDTATMDGDEDTAEYLRTVRQARLATKFEKPNCCPRLGRLGKSDQQHGNDAGLGIM